MPTTCGHGFLLNEGLCAETRRCTGFTERTPRDDAKAKKQTTPATHKTGWLVNFGCGEKSKLPEPAQPSCGRLAGGGAVAGPWSGGRLPALACPQLTYPPEFQASGASRSIRAAPRTAHDRRCGDPEPRPDSKNHRLEWLAEEVLLEPR
ncbi:hypothetical protein HispidOSU_000096 [Sigmodon hispidus]